MVWLKSLTRGTSNPSIEMVTITLWIVYPQSRQIRRMIVLRAMRASSVVLILFAAARCNSPRQDRMSNLRASDSTCVGVGVPVHQNNDSISHERTCQFVRDALHELAAAKPEVVILSPGDTAKVVSATVGVISQLDSATHAPIASWWL